MSIAVRGRHCWRPFLAWPSLATWLSSSAPWELRVETALLHTRHRGQSLSQSFLSLPTPSSLDISFSLTHRTTVLLVQLLASDLRSPLWFLILSHTLCSPNSVTAAQLCSVYWGVEFPCHSFSLPTTTWALPTFRTLYLTSAGSAFLPELLMAGSFSPLSSQLKCPSSVNPL